MDISIIQPKPLLFVLFVILNACVVHPHQLYVHNAKKIIIYIKLLVIVIALKIIKKIVIIDYV